MKTYFRLTFKLKLDLIWLEALGLNFVNNFEYLYNFQALLKYHWELGMPLFRNSFEMNLYLYEAEFCKHVGQFNGQCGCNASLIDFAFICLFIQVSASLIQSH